MCLLFNVDSSHFSLSYIKGGTVAKQFSQNYPLCSALELSGEFLNPDQGAQRNAALNGDGEMKS